MAAISTDHLAQGLNKFFYQPAGYGGLGRRLWQIILSKPLSVGDLAGLARALDDLRHESVAKLLVPLPWSPWQSIDLDRVPTDGRTQRPSLFMEDTVWPFEQKLDEYIERSGSHYAREMRDTEDAGRRILTVDASFRTAFGTGRRREIIRWQKVRRPEAMQALLCNEVPARYKQPGTWMHDALQLRDQWESRLLRTVDWSPLA